jgi:hypothetical protein
MSDKFERIWKEMVLVLYQYLLCETEENYEKLSQDIRCPVQDSNRESPEYI